MREELDPSVSNIIHNALDFAKAGYHVFPLLKNLINENNRLGTPIGWNHNKPDNPLSIPSTTDVMAIVEWEFKYGNNLHGYGVNPRNNHALILDVDIKEGKHGLRSLERLIEQYNLPKATFAVRSKSGGRHFYYKYPENADIVGIPFPNFQHIDIRTANTFVVGPGSMGGKYVVDYGSPLEHDKLVGVGEDVESLLPKRQQIKSQVIDIEVQDISISGEIPEVIKLGERDNTIIRLIGSWVRAGFSKKNVIILTEAAIAKCEKSKSDPISIEEYLPKIESTFDKSTFSRPAPEPLQFFIDNAIWVKSIGGVYEIPSRRVYTKDLASLYAPHIYYIEQETAKGKTTKEISAFSAWKKNKKRKEVQGIGYHPTPDTITYDDVQAAEICNLYIPPVFPKILEVECPVPDIAEQFEQFCHYLFGSKAEFMLDWAAHIVQHPDQKLSIAPVMVSEARGVGKNMFFDIISTLIGKHNAAVFSTEQIASKHNDYILRNHLVLINESYISNVDRCSMKSRHQMIEDIKMLITDYAQSVDPKFITPFMTRSYVNYIFASNNLNAVPIEENDRRFEIIIIDAKPANADVYNTLWKITENNNTGKLLAAFLRDHLMKRNITKVKVGMTASVVDEHKAMVIAANRSSVEEALFFAIQEKDSVFKKDIVTFELFAWFVLEKADPTVTLENIRALFKTMCKPIYVSGQRLNRQLTVDYPMLNIKGAQLQGGRGRKGIYTCRRFAYYDDHRDIDSKILSLDYQTNFEATKPSVREPVHISSGLELVK
jgi:hypothetical protein